MPGLRWPAADVVAADAAVLLLVVLPGAAVEPLPEPEVDEVFDFVPFIVDYTSLAQLFEIYNYNRKGVVRGGKLPLVKSYK